MKKSFDEKRDGSEGFIPGHTYTISEGLTREI